MQVKLFKVPYAYLGKTPEAGTADITAPSPEKAARILGMLRPNAIIGDPWEEQRNTPEERMFPTVGPWEKDTQSFVEEESESPYIVIFGPDGPGHGRVAMVFAELGREDELEPNAIVIAAVPELLGVYDAAITTAHNNPALGLALKEAREALDK